MLNITDFTQDFEHYQISISIFNGYIWSNGSTQGPTLDVTLKRLDINYIPPFPPIFENTNLFHQIDLNLSRTGFDAYELPYAFSPFDETWDITITAEDVPYFATFNEEYVFTFDLDLINSTSYYQFNGYSIFMGS